MITKILFLCMAFGSSLFAQAQYAESYLLLQETLGNCAKMVDVARTNDLEVVKIEIDLIGANPKITLKAMSPDFTYAIFVQGSTSRIADLDVAVFESDGTTLVQKDVSTSPLAMVSFKPAVAGYYVIQITAAKMMPGYEGSMGQFCLVVTHN